MNHTLKKAISIMLSISILILSNIPTFAATKSPNITIKLNGKIVTFDAKPKSQNGRILVPVAPLAKELGATVEWIATTKSVIITLPTKVKNKTIYFKLGQASALVDGMEVKLDAAPTTYQNRTFIPLRFVSENFGAKVKWNGKTKTVSITYVAPKKEKPQILIPPWELPNLQTTGSAITTGIEQSASKNIIIPNLGGQNYENH